MLKSVPTYILSGYDAIVGEVWTYQPTSRQYQESDEPVSATKNSQCKGKYDTPEEWWYAQEQFYGKPVPPFKK